MAGTEPNSLPPLFQTWEDWRETYKSYVADYRAAQAGMSHDTRLRIRLERLGFAGVNLEAELTYIKNGGN